MSDLVIRARDLTKHYGDTIGLEELDLEVRRGDVFGFLGPNGAGKTTTIRLLLDLIRPTRGEARIFGKPAKECALRARVGYLPGELTLDGRLTGRQTLEFLAALRGPGTDRLPAGSRERCCARNEGKKPRYMTMKSVFAMRSTQRFGPVNCAISTRKTSRLSPARVPRIQSHGPPASCG